MKTVAYWIRFSLSAAWFAFTCTWSFFESLVRWRDPSNGHRFGRLLCAGSRFTLGVRTRLVGGETLEQAQPCVYVANHQSNADNFIYGAMYPRRTIMTGKREVLYIPFFGLMFYAMGNILLDRGKGGKATAQLGQAVERLRAGESIWVFVEGHRNPLPEMLPFKKGAFRLAIEAQVPIVPLVSGLHNRLIDFAGKRIRPGVCEVRVLEPISTTGMTLDDVDRLLDLTRARMVEGRVLADAGTVPSCEVATRRKSLEASRR